MTNIAFPSTIGVTYYVYAIVSPTPSDAGCRPYSAFQVTVQECVEDCSNGIDDDLDGLIDCADPDCIVDEPGSIGGN